MRKNVVFEKGELADLQAAVIRMLWTWQARQDAEHRDAEKYLERYHRLYVKIAGVRWSQDDA